MKQGFVKVAAVTPNVRVADVDYNKEQIFKCLDEALLEKAKVIVFPELCVTGYTCGDLFAQNALIQKAEEALEDIVAYTIDKDALVFAKVFKKMIGIPPSSYRKKHQTEIKRQTGKGVPEI